MTIRLEGNTLADLVKEKGEGHVLALLSEIEANAGRDVEGAVSLVPRRAGVEKTHIDKGDFPYGLCAEGHVFTAFAGTGFDEDNPQHTKGSDGLRYAIAIQQARDDKDYEAADAMCDRLKSTGWDVGKAHDRTVLKRR